MQISKVILKDITKILVFAKFENVQNIIVNSVTIINTYFFTFGNSKSLPF